MVCSDREIRGAHTESCGARVTKCKKEKTERSYRFYYSSSALLSQPRYGIPELFGFYWDYSSLASGALVTVVSVPTTSLVTSGFAPGSVLTLTWKSTVVRVSDAGTG